jgi:amino acid adenylation domain-containing protein
MSGVQRVETNSRLSRIEPSVSTHDLFGRLAGEQPRLPAVLDGKSNYTFSDLENLSRRVARRLRVAGAIPGSIVGILAHRGVQSVIAGLAALRCGACYLPLDATYPADALDFIISDCRPSVLLHGAGVTVRLEKASSIESLDLDRAIGDASLDTAPWTDAAVGGEAAAYVMYTSGSTGRPKGVVVPHRGIVGLVTSQNYMDFAEPQVFLHHSPPSFDASTWEVWGALLNGNPVAIYGDERISLSGIADAIGRHGVTTMWLTAGLFHAFADHDVGMLRGLKTLIVGGDVVQPRAARSAIDKLPGCQLVNGYGPTEATTFSCCYRLPADLPADRPIPIGRAIAGAEAFITDGKLVPVRVGDGEVGELLITGNGVALGYLDRPELTLEKFVTVRFGDRESRAYRTGDLARVDENGNIEFAGRVDRQVKVAGKRIELDEIEVALRRDFRVADAVTMLDTDAQGRKHIVCFIRPAPGAAGDAANDIYRDSVLSAYRGRMPEHMVPHETFVVDTYPLSVNGKVDRVALLASVRTRSGELEQPFFDDATPLERAIAGFWRDSLGRSDFGLHHNFFDCGGTSLAVVEVHARLQSALGRQVPITELFAHPTVSGLATSLSDPDLPSGNLAEAATQRAGRQKAALARLRGGRTSTRG